MKRLLIAALTVLTVLAFPMAALADVAGVGTIIVFGLLPYILIAAVLVTAVVVLIKVLRRRRAAAKQTEPGRGRSEK